MGIFKDVLRNLSESSLTERELHLKRAAEAESTGDWSTARWYYDKAGAWEKEADAWLRLRDSKGPDDDNYVFWSCEIAQLYFKAGRHSKMRELYQAAFLAGGHFGKDTIQILNETGQLNAFMKDILRTSLRDDEDSRREHNKYTSLFEALYDAKEFAHALEFFRHFRKALRHWNYAVISYLCKTRKIQEAIELCRALARDQCLDADDYRLFASLFEDARGYNEARETYGEYLKLEPYDAVRGGHKVFKDTGQWEGFLEEALQQNPRQLGLALATWDKPIDKWSEVEADILLRCYWNSIGIPGFQGYEQMGRRWLDLLVAFWKPRGNLTKAGELRLRWLEFRKRVGVVDFLQSCGYSEGQRIHIPSWDTGHIADLIVKAANDPCVPERRREFLHVAAEFYVRAGNKEKGGELFQQLGRSARADRLRGIRRFSLDEARLLFEVFGPLGAPGELGKAILDQVAGLSSTQEVKGAAEQFRDQVTLAKTWTWADFCVALRLYKAANDYEGYKEKLRYFECQFRDNGAWFFAAKTYLFEELYDEFDRVCNEQDELEVAALWYEQAKMPERAAKIYDLMGQSGKSDKAQANGAKQKPQDAAKSKSDSVEESDRSDFDQQVCPQCGTEVKPHWTVCPKCDADLQQRNCRNCGEPLQPDWKRCPVCRKTASDGD